MGVTTRSASSSPAKKQQLSKTTVPTAATTDTLESIKVLYLPKNLSQEARILSLRHPRDSSPKRFLFCPVHGLYEFTRIAQPPSECRSLLFASAASNGPPVEPVPASDDSLKFIDGYISKDASLLIATPFDLFFFLLSVLPSTMAGSTKPLFQPIDDLFDNAVEEDNHLKYIISKGRLLVEEALRKCCDTVEAGDDTMFRVSEQKTLDLIRQKINRTVEKGLPSTMEERFVTRALETPVLSVKRETSTVSTTTLVAEDGELEMDANVVKESAIDSQSSTASTAPSVVFSEVSAASSTTTIVSPTETLSPEILRLQHLKVALDFILASYVSSKVAESIRGSFSSKTSPIDFEVLETHLAHLTKLRAEALASRSLGDFSRKRGLDDEELAEERAEKKRKKDEEEKRKKASLSRGVKDLAKVNVTGMKKMSAFFMAKPKK